MEALLFLLLCVVVGLLHGIVLRFTLPEEARSRSVAAGMIAGPPLVVLGALPFLMPLLIGLIFSLIGFYVMMRLMHDQSWMVSTLVLIADVLLCGSAALLVIDVMLLATGMESVSQGF